MTEPARPTIGAKRITALALAVADLDVMHRTTVRALLPTGKTRPSNHATTNTVNAMTVKFQNALRTFEQRGWITREGMWVHIGNRGALMKCAYNRDESLPEQLLDVAAALATVRSRVVLEVVDIERRDREVAALQALMRAPVGGMYRGRGAVRRQGVAGSDRT